MDRSQALTKLSNAVQSGQLHSVSKLLDLHGSVLSLNGEEGTVLLSKAVRHGRCEIAQLLLRRGARINSTSTSGDTPLHLAVKRKDVQIIQMLLQEEAAVNCTNALGRTPLHYATDRHHLEVVRLLLQKGADVNITDHSGITALHHAATCGYTEVVRELLKTQPHVNIPNHIGRTPIFNAAELGRVKVGKLLLDNGACVNFSEDTSELTPLHLAVDGNHIKFVMLLLENRACVIAEDSEGKTPLHVAVNKRNYLLVELLLGEEVAFNSYDNSGRTPLQIAIKSESVDIVNLLLEKGADVNHTKEYMNTPLHFAVDVRNVKIIDLLLQKGADVTKTDCKDLRTPLHRAVCRENVEVVQALLLKDEAVNISDEDENTPLHDAVSRGNLEIVKLLLEKKASVNVANSKKQTPLHFALSRKTCPLDIVDLLLSNGADVIACDFLYGSPLFYAIKHCSPEVVQKLCSSINFVVNSLKSDDIRSDVQSLELTNVEETLKQNSDDVMAITGEEKPAVPVMTPQEYSQLVDHILKNCNLSKERICDVLRASVLVDDKFFSDDLVQTLLTHGCSLAQEAHNGTLFYAALKNHSDYVIVELLKNGFDVNAEYGLNDGDLFMPLHIAVQEKFINAARLLISHGADVNEVCGDDCLAPIMYLKFEDDKSDYPMHEFLIKQGLDAESKNTTLMYAVSAERTDIIELLVKHETDVCHRDSEGFTVLHRAVFEKGCPHADCVKLLLSNGADVNAKIDSYVSVLHIASLLAPKHEEVFRTLLEYNPDVNATCEDVTPLHLCALTRNFSFCQLLLSKGAGAEVNAKLSNDCTALHVAVTKEPCLSAFEMYLSWLQYSLFLSYGNAVTMEELEKEYGYRFPKLCDVVMIEDLLNSGADVNSKDFDGKTALHYVVENSQLGHVKALIKHGADIGVRDNFSKTALQYAGLEERSSLRIVQTLVWVGADVNCRDSEGCTLLHKSVQVGGKYTRDLLALGCDINVSNNAGRTALEEARSSLIRFRKLSNNDDGEIETNIYYLRESAIPCLMQHIVQLKAANRYVSPKNLLALGGLCYDDFYNKCKEEISALKTEKTGASNLSYYDVFRCSRNQLARLANCCDLVTELEAESLSKKYRIYAQELKVIAQHLKLANRRKLLLDSSIQVFRSYIWELPVECVDFIFDDLSGADLENLMRAFYPDRSFPGESDLMGGDENVQDTFADYYLNKAGIELRFSSDEEGNNSDNESDMESDSDHDLS